MTLRQWETCTLWLMSLTHTCQPAGNLLGPRLLGDLRGSSRARQGPTLAGSPRQTLSSSRWGVALAIAITTTIYEAKGGLRVTMVMIDEDMLMNDDNNDNDERNDRDDDNV